ncbi:Uncharacterised protein [Mycobacteroides abscessus subsp. massiliense]|uniref:hypothetical protein n=1 Tax=Mycobacteroides abscessus TaxID=36809 RepID=UPI0009C46C44|nr:hypothetical protein [Mycobacteroides abscessus]SKT94182.1 Uncharacterised protein [Mycobacteroides abscessus subsp. massiliense]SKU20197.1 Uncharacterised protein [Mycobacteroides abscessus subsp. massiliense]
MARIVWDYDHPRRAVWAAVLDADQWPLGFEGFEAARGTVFHSGLFPTLTTGYSGWLECEVTEVKEFEHMTIRVVAPKNNVMTQTCWELSSDLHDSIGGGTEELSIPVDRLVSGDLRSS